MNHDEIRSLLISGTSGAGNQFVISYQSNGHDYALICKSQFHSPTRSFYWELIYNFKHEYLKLACEAISPALYHSDPDMLVKIENVFCKSCFISFCLSFELEKINKKYQVENSRQPSMISRQAVSSCPLQLGW